VISPEGCASILWRDAARAEEAATAMKITASDLKALGVVDEIVPEPSGGAHVDHDALFRTIDVVIEAQLRELADIPPDSLIEARYQKFRNMGRLGHDFYEEESYRVPARGRAGPGSRRMSGLPVDPERLRAQFPDLTDEDVDAYVRVTRTVMAAGDARSPRDAGSARRGPEARQKLGRETP
jgi:hypothetical protein